VLFRSQLSFQLRARQPTAIYEPGLGQVVLQVGQTRASRSPSAADTLAVPDTTGN